VALPDPVTAEPIRRETVMETVARRIESLIRGGDLRVGSRLPPEPKLAAMLGVSRSSLREALKGLMFLGLIKARPGYGTYIQSSLGRVVSRHFQWMLLLQEIKYLELYELRKILEPTVAALAARRANAEDLAKMEAAIRGMKASFNRPEQYMAFEMTFHEEFAHASKNAAVETLLRMMYDALAEGRRRTLPLIDDFARNFERHQRIFRLIANRDVAGARRGVLDDLRYAETLLRKDLEAQKRFSDRMESAHPAPSTQRKAPAKAWGARLKRR
jgi:GntR family transcriptional regulator, transcriptional repressor for pyruvate dehydrogenase complex